MGYWHRRSTRIEKAQQRASSSHFIKLLEINSIQRRYEMAWRDLYGTEVSVTYSHGWYWILGHAYRQSVVTKLTLILEARLHERDFAVPEEIS